MSKKRKIKGDSVTKVERKFMNKLSEHFFGDTIDNLLRKLKEAEDGLKKLERERAKHKKAEKLRKAEEAKRKKAEEKRKAEEAKRKEEQINTILFLSETVKMSAAKIAEGLGYDLEFIRSVIENKK